MPRGNPAIWKKHGQSYSELAGTTTSFEQAQGIAPRRLPPVAPATMAEVRARKAAGAAATVPPRGAGSFQMQTGWSLGVPVPGGQSSSATTRSSDGAGLGPSSLSASGAFPPRTYATETRANFPPPPSDFRRARSAGPLASQMPKPNHPNDWTTSEQLDFKTDRLAGSQPPQPLKQRDSGRLLPSDVPCDTPATALAHFTTQQRVHFPGRTLREAQAVPVSGCRATQPSGYNIITGAPAFVNNAFEHWDGRDYRRHR